MSSTIYILTEGDYSDYHVIGAYSSEELADKAKVLYPDSQIEEYDLDIIPEHPPGMVAWCVVIRDNTVSDSYQIAPPLGPLPFPYEWDYENHMLYRLWATDKEHAEKIALDRYYQHKAQEARIA